MQLAAYLVSSAERTSITMILSCVRLNGAYNSLIISSAARSSVPIIILSGLMQSLTAAPSFKNSGFETTEKDSSVPKALSSFAWHAKLRAASVDLMQSLTLSAVPTGTVDLLMMILRSCI